MTKMVKPTKWHPDEIAVVLAQTVCYLLQCATEKLMNRDEGFSERDAWNQTAGIRLRQLAMAHSAYFTFNSFREAVAQEQN